MTPEDKTFRVPVKLVSTVDGAELPFKGLMLVPEDRLGLLEQIAVAARDLTLAQKESARAGYESKGVAPALKSLSASTEALSKIWEIPQS